MDVYFYDMRYVISGTTSTSAKVTDDLVFVQAVKWVGATTASHKARIDNRNGQLLYYFTADEPGTSGELMYEWAHQIKPMPCNGLYVSDLDSGYLIIELTSSPGAL